MYSSTVGCRTSYPKCDVAVTPAPASAVARFATSSRNQRSEVRGLSLSRVARDFAAFIWAAVCYISVNDEMLGRAVDGRSTTSHVRSASRHLQKFFTSQALEQFGELPGTIAASAADLA